MSARRASLILLASLLAAAPVMTPPALARGAPNAQQGPLSLGQAAEHVRKRVGGQVLAAEAVREDERDYYLVRILVRRGQVKVYRVDPATGRID